MGKLLESCGAWKGEGVLNHINSKWVFNPWVLWSANSEWVQAGFWKMPWNYSSWRNHKTIKAQKVLTGILDGKTARLIAQKHFWAERNFIELRKEDKNLLPSQIKGTRFGHCQFAIKNKLTYWINSFRWK